MAHLQWQSPDYAEFPAPCILQLHVACRTLRGASPEIVKTVAVSYALPGARVDSELLVEYCQQVADEYGLRAALTQFKPPVFTVRFTRRGDELVGIRVIK